MNVRASGRMSIVLAAVLAAGLPLPSPAGGPDDSAPSPMAAFFARMQPLKDTFDHFRFLTGPEVETNPAWKPLAAQLLATDYSFLGRPEDALREFPAHDTSPAPAGVPTPETHTTMPAAAWIAGQSEHYRVVMVNEAHHQPQTRLLTLSLLAVLRERGFTHLAVETLADPLPSEAYPTLDTGYYSREPIFAEIIRDARRLGYVLVPYEPAFMPGQTQQQRETGMAGTLATLMQQHPEAKLLVHAGYGHISKASRSQPSDADPMAREFMRLTGLPVLNLDQTKLTWEEGRAQARLARAFGIDAPSILLANDGGKAWSALPDRFDASVVLPGAPSTALRPDWLALGGRRQAVAIDLAPCADHLPCLAEARYASEGDDAIPADQFVMLDASDTGTPLYLAPGDYRLRMRGNDGKPLAERVLHVPPTPSTNLPAGTTR